MLSGGDTMAENRSREKRIRARVSYREYVELADLLRSEPTLKQVAEWFYRKLDMRHAYGSETHSYYAYESLKQFVKDYNGKIRVKVITTSKQAKNSLKTIVSMWFPEGIKCPECNWEVETLYSFSNVSEDSLCANCFIEMIMANGMKII